MFSSVLVLRFSVSEFLNSAGNNLGFFSIVNYDDTTPDGYDLDKFGPQCVAQCVALRLQVGPCLLTAPSARPLCGRFCMYFRWVLS